MNDDKQDYISIAIIYGTFALLLLPAALFQGCDLGIPLCIGLGVVATVAVLLSLKRQ